MMDEPTASLTDARWSGSSGYRRLRGRGRRRHLHLASARGSVRDRGPRHRAARRRDGRPRATAATSTRRSSIRLMVGRELAEVVSEAAGARRDDVALELRAPVEPRRRPARRVAVGPARRDPRAGGPGRVGTDRAGRNALRPDAGRRGRDPARRHAGADRLAGGRHCDSARLRPGGPPPARRRARDVDHGEHHPREPAAVSRAG